MQGKWGPFSSTGWFWGGGGQGDSILVHFSNTILWLTVCDMEGLNIAAEG